MSRILVKSKCLRAHYLHILSRASTNLHKCSNISRRFASTETVIAEKHSKFRRKIVIASSLIIGAATGFAIFDYKRTETEAKEHEFPSILERGGPKNLPIATHLIDEKDFDTSKPRLVILGSGWGVGI